MKNKAFVLPSTLAKKVDRIQKELGYENPGMVITKAIDLLDLSIGRKIVLEQPKQKKKIEIKELEDYQNTFQVYDNDGE